MSTIYNAWNAIKGGVQYLRNSLPTALFYGLALTIGIVITWFTYNYAILFSDFGLIILFLVICMGSYHLFDRVVLKEIDFISEIRSDEKNLKEILLTLLYFSLLLLLFLLVLLRWANAQQTTDVPAKGQMRNMLSGPPGQRYHLLWG